LLAGKKIEDLGLTKWEITEIERVAFATFDFKTLTAWLSDSAVTFDLASEPFGNIGGSLFRYYKANVNSEIAIVHRKKDTVVPMQSIGVTFFSMMLDQFEVSNVAANTFAEASSMSNIMSPYVFDAPQGVALKILFKWESTLTYLPSSPKLTQAVTILENAFGYTQIDREHINTWYSIALNLLLQRYLMESSEYDGNRSSWIPNENSRYSLFHAPASYADRKYYSVKGNEQRENLVAVGNIFQKMNVFLNMTNAQLAIIVESESVTSEISQRKKIGAWLVVMARLFGYRQKKSSMSYVYFWNMVVARTYIDSLPVSPYRTHMQAAVRASMDSLIRIRNKFVRGRKFVQGTASGLLKGLNYNLVFETVDRMTQIIRDLYARRHFGLMPYYFYAIMDDEHPGGLYDAYVYVYCTLNKETLERKWEEMPNLAKSAARITNFFNDQGALLKDNPKRTYELLEQVYFRILPDLEMLHRRYIESYDMGISKNLTIVLRSMQTSPIALAFENRAFVNDLQIPHPDDKHALTYNHVITEFANQEGAFPRQKLYFRVQTPSFVIYVHSSSAWRFDRVTIWIVAHTVPEREEIYRCYIFLVSTLDGRRTQYGYGPYYTAVPDPINKKATVEVQVDPAYSAKRNFAIMMGQEDQVMQSPGSGEELFDIDDEQASPPSIDAPTVQLLHVPEWYHEDNRSFRHRLDFLLPFMQAIQQQMNIVGLASARMHHAPRHSVKPGDIILSLEANNVGLYEPTMMYINGNSTPGKNLTGVTRGLMTTENNNEPQLNEEDRYFLYSTFRLGNVYENSHYKPGQFDLSGFRLDFRALDWITSYLLLPLHQMIRTRSKWDRLTSQMVRESKLFTGQVPLPISRARPVTPKIPDGMTREDVRIPYKSPIDVAHTAILAMDTAVSIASLDRIVSEVIYFPRERFFDDSMKGIMKENTRRIDPLGMIRGELPLLNLAAYTRQHPHAIESFEIMRDANANAIPASIAPIRYMRDDVFEAFNAVPKSSFVTEWELILTAKGNDRHLAAELLAAEFEVSMLDRVIRDVDVVSFGENPDYATVKYGPLKEKRVVIKNVLFQKILRISEAVENRAGEKVTLHGIIRDYITDQDVLFSPYKKN
jgi:hypothetical protein